VKLLSKQLIVNDLQEDFLLFHLYTRQTALETFEWNKCTLYERNFKENLDGDLVILQLLVYLALPLSHTPHSFRNKSVEFLI
jgi:hypothetical protein